MSSTGSKESATLRSVIMASDRSSKDLKDAELYADDSLNEVQGQEQEHKSSLLESVPEAASGFKSASPVVQGKRNNIGSKLEIEAQETDSEAGSDTFEDVEVQDVEIASATRTSLGPEGDRSLSPSPAPAPVITGPSPPATPIKSATPSTGKALDSSVSSIRARIQALNANASPSPSKPLYSRSISPSPSKSPSRPTIEIETSVVDLTDIPLNINSPAYSPVSSKDRLTYTLSAPRPMQMSDMLPSPIATPPVESGLSFGSGSGQTPATARSFFPTLGFGLPGSSPAPAPASAAAAAIPPPRSTTPTPSTSWRSSFANLLPSASKSAATTPSPPKPTPPPMTRTLSGSTAMLLSKVSSSTSQIDRRRSREAGGETSLQHGFHRLKGEMEGTAREMRRELEKDSVVEGGVDWAFWGAVVQDYEEMARTRPKELSRAIQQGIPAVIRGHIWQLMSASKSADLEATYKDLLKQTSPHEKSIQKDLCRTFPNHEFFQQGGGVGQEGLFMVVKAYSLYDRDVGYTQGLAFIVAALLLNMPDEEAFCVLVRLMESYDLRSHFLADMPGLQLRLFQFDRLVEDILPLIHVHFMRAGVKSSMFASQWFMTMFSYRFPLSLVYRVLDIVFAEGVEAIFRFSIALLKKSEDELCTLDFEAILKYLQSSLFERYKQDENERDDADPDHLGEGDWKANEFVRDAYEVRITPFMLDSYAAEWDDQCKAQNRHAEEVDNLRNANRHLSSTVKSLESSLTTMNQEHVELVRQLVMSKIEKEEIENELVRYKMLYAELAHAQQDALSSHSRLSSSSLALAATPSRSSTS